METEDLQKQCKALHLIPGETLAFLSHHKGGAAKDARFLKDKICEILKIPQEQVFLDSDQSGFNLNDLMTHVRNARVVVLIQTEQTLFRPYVIGELFADLQQFGKLHLKK